MLTKACSLWHAGFAMAAAAGLALLLAVMMGPLLLWSATAALQASNTRMTRMSLRTSAGSAAGTRNADQPAAQSEHVALTPTQSRAASCALQAPLSPSPPHPQQAQPSPPPPPPPPSSSPPPPPGTKHLLTKVDEYIQKSIDAKSPDVKSDKVSLLWPSAVFLVVTRVFICQKKRKSEPPSPPPELSDVTWANLFGAGDEYKLDSDNFYYAAGTIM